LALRHHGAVGLLLSLRGDGRRGGEGQRRGRLEARLAQRLGKGRPQLQPQLTLN
jgi:hypothetical protein